MVKQAKGWAWWLGLGQWLGLGPGAWRRPLREWTAGQWIVVLAVALLLSLLL